MQVFWMKMDCYLVLVLRCVSELAEIVETSKKKKSSLAVGTLYDIEKKVKQSCGFIYRTKQST
eukprot:UN25865